MPLSRKDRRALARKEGGSHLLALPKPHLAIPQPRPGVTFAIPLEEIMFSGFFTNWLEVEQYRLGSDFVVTTTGSFTWIARNGLVKRFLNETDAEYLLFLDSDNCAPTGFDFIKRLISHKKDIVAGWYKVKKTRQPTVYTFDHWNEMEETPYWKQRGKDDIPEDENAPECQCGKHHAQTIEKVDATGAGCLLIHRSVFERMPEPWFGHFKGGGTEDMWFAWECRKLGIEWYVDWAVHSAHLGLFAT